MLIRLWWCFFSSTGFRGMLKSQLVIYVTNFYGIFFLNVFDEDKLWQEIFFCFLSYNWEKIVSSTNLSPQWKSQNHTHTKDTTFTKTYFVLVFIFFLVFFLLVFLLFIFLFILLLGMQSVYNENIWATSWETCLCHMRTTKAQISLRICAVWSAPLLFAAWIV